MPKQRKTSHLAKTMLINFVAGWALILTCSAAANMELLGKLESSIANFAIWTSVCLILLIGAFRSQATRLVTVALMVFVGCSTVAFAVDVTRDIRALDGVPLFGRGGANTHLFEDTLIAACTAALVYLLFAALRSVEESHDNLNLRVEERTASLREARQHLETRVEQRTKELADSEERFRAMAEASPSVVWVADENMKLTYVNDRWLRFTGRPVEQELGDGWFDRIHPDDAQGALQTIQSAYQLRREFELEKRMRRHDGDYCWFHDQAAPRFAEDGQFLGFVGSCVDVTARKHAEEALRQSDRLASLGTLAAGIAHEINNPMSAAWTAAETAGSLTDDDPLGADLLRECLETICDSVQRSQEIIKNVLRLARSESSQKHRCDVNKVVRQAVGAVSYYAKSRNAVIGLELSSPLPQAELCEAEIEQSLINLIRNAIQASEKSRVIVTTAEEDGCVRIQVADNGRGIAPTDLDQIFDPFFTKNIGGEGTGLGLALTHQIVKDHGGQIDVASQIGVGTTFTIILPSLLEDKAGEEDAEAVVGETP